MIGQAVKETAGLADRRSFVTAFLPSFMFSLLLTAAWAVTEHHSIKATLTWWTACQTSVQLTALITLLAASALLAQILQATRVTLINLFVGHGTVSRCLRLATLGRTLHRRRVRRDTLNHTTLRYPPPAMPEELQPTRLGNILRAGELYPLARYGIDAVVVWPRLFHVLPDRLLSTLTDARAQLELLLTISALGGTFSLVVGVWLYFAPVSTALVLACLWGGGLVAWAAYLAALSAAVTYSHQLASAFDLHRRSLIAHLGEVFPESPDEHEYWARLTQFWRTGRPRTNPSGTPTTPYRPVSPEKLRLCPTLAGLYLAVTFALGLLMVTTRQH